MVADTYPGGPGDAVAIRPGDDSMKTTTATTGREDAHGARRLRPRARDARWSSSKNLRVTWNGRALRDKEKLYEAGVRFDSTIQRRRGPNTRGGRAARRGVKPVAEVRKSAGTARKTAAAPRRGRHILEARPLRAGARRARRRRRA